MILYPMILSFIPPAFRIFAPFLHRFCTMNRNSSPFSVHSGSAVLNSSPQMTFPKKSNLGHVWSRLVIFCHLGWTGRMALEKEFW